MKYPTDNAGIQIQSLTFVTEHIQSNSSEIIVTLGTHFATTSGLRANSRKTNEMALAVVSWPVT